METLSPSPVPLSSAQRRDLRARAHKLEPVVLVGDKGITAELIAEVTRALEAHELIKVRAAALERSEREWALNELCRRTGSQPVQTIGKTLVLFRRSTQADAKPAAKHATAAPLTRPSIRSGRRESRSASVRPASAPPRRRPATSR